MSYEPKDGDISVFKNRKKEKENHPDYTGKAQINGETWYVSFWIKQKDGGDAFFSGQIQQKKEQSSNAVDPINPEPGQVVIQDKVPQSIDDSSDLPFILTIPLIPLGLLASSILSMLC